MESNPQGKGRIRLGNQAGILQAAEYVFARAGLVGATMGEIALRVGVPKSNLHYYFRTKKDIYRAVFSNTLSLWLAETDGCREVVIRDGRFRTTSARR